MWISFPVSKLKSITVEQVERGSPPENPLPTHPFFSSSLNVFQDGC